MTTGSVPAGVSVRLSYQGIVEEFFVLCLSDILVRIASMGVLLDESKLILPRGAGVISGNELNDIIAATGEEGAEKGKDVMERLAAAKKVMLVGPKASDVEQVRAMKEDNTIRGFDQEMERARQRVNSPGGMASSSATTTRRSHGVSSLTSMREHFFGSIEVLSLPELENHPSIPSRERAEQLLKKLATDPAIVHIMHARHWTVGKLTELPPLGKVGISPACLLGLNKNNGEEICLRIRTDDLKGFRKYGVIIDTLLHELAHNVFSEHDNNFKMLNSELKKEYKDYHMKHIVNRLEEGGDPRGSSLRWDDSELDKSSENTSKDGRKLGRS